MQPKAGASAGHGGRPRPVPGPPPAATRALPTPTCSMTTASLSELVPCRCRTNCLMYGCRSVTVDTCRRRGRPLSRGPGPDAQQPRHGGQSGPPCSPAGQGGWGGGEGGAAPPVTSPVAAVPARETQRRVGGRDVDGLGVAVWAHPALTRTCPWGLSTPRWEVQPEQKVGAVRAQGHQSSGAERRVLGGRARGEPQLCEVPLQPSAGHSGTLLEAAALGSAEQARAATWGGGRGPLPGRGE